jgi:hypothetical protein
MSTPDTNAGDSSSRSPAVGMHSPMRAGSDSSLRTGSPRGQPALGIKTDSLALSSDSEHEDAKSDTTPTSSQGNASVRVVSRRREDNSESKSESKFSGANRSTAKALDSPTDSGRGTGGVDDVQEFDSP